MRSLTLLVLLLGCTGDDTTDDKDGAPTGDTGQIDDTGTDRPDPCEGLTEAIAIDEDIFDTTEWTCTNVAYQVQAGVRVLDGARLTIGPGVEVQFDAGAHLEVGTGSNGASIVADGTDEAITFTSSLPAPAQGAHGGVIIGANASSAIFRNVTIEWGGAEVATPYGPVQANLGVRGTTEITNCTFTDSAGYGVQFIQGGRPSPFRDNTFARIGLQAVSIGVTEVSRLDGPNTIESTQVIAVAGGTLADDATWSDVGAPYRLIGSVLVQGKDDPQLTIEAGTTLQLTGPASLIVGRDAPGGITATGTGSDPVTFTSAEATPAPGDFTSVVIDVNASTASFDHAAFSYGGDLNLQASRSGGGTLLVVDNQVNISNSSFTDNEEAGLRLLGTAAVATFATNTFSDNDAPILLPASAVASLSGTHTFGAGEVIEVRGGTLETTSTWNDVGAPYNLVDDVFVEGTGEPVLTLSAGIELQITREASLVIGANDPGGLVADGTAGRITFTSDADTPAAGDWESVSFDTQTIEAVIRNADFRYCGEPIKNLSKFPAEGCVIAVDVDPTIEDSTFEDSSTNGIALYGTATSDNLSGNTFTNIAGAEVFED